MNQYHKSVKHKNRYREFVRVLNGALQLTERELDVFSALIAIDKDWPADLGEYKNVLSTDSRRIVMSETRINKSNLTKYAKQFKEKGLVISDDHGNAIVNPIFIPIDAPNDSFEILFVLDLKTDKDEFN